MEHQFRILIIDDEPVVRNTLETLLLSVDAELVFAENGRAGLEYAVTLSPDLILLDVMMPDMDGFEVCSKIRTIPGLAQVPIIMITALDDRDSRLRGLRAGADDFLAKPFDGLELIARIQTILRLNRYHDIVRQRDELAILHQELLKSYLKTIEGWSRALDLRDKETEGHTLRVTQKMVELARAVGISGEKELEDVRIGALLHDIGKLGVPDAILLKPGKLTPEEWVVMRRHPVYAYEWLSPISFLEKALDIPYCHHEKWDGSGYPRGLSGEAIPLTARLFAIIDVWDALCSERPYRAAVPEPEVLDMIEHESGKHFEPKLAAAFLELQKKPRQA
jgi:putative two-component system response regulator